MFQNSELNPENSLGSEAELGNIPYSSVFRVRIWNSVDPRYFTELFQVRIETNFSVKWKP